MAHNLNFNKGKAAFFSVKEKAWHGLGKIVQEAPTSEEAIKLAQLDYEVVKQPVYLADGTVVEDSFATVRKDTNKPFGIVGSRYEVLQNVEAFDFFDHIVGNKEAIYETAGALGDGETIFITAKLPEYIKVGNGDKDLIEQYLFLTNNHNGKGVVQAAFTPIRIVCNNTLNAALANNSNRVRIMHNANVRDRLKEASKLMGIVNKLKEELETVFNVMAKKPMVDQALKDFIVATFAAKNHLDMIAKGEECATLSRFESLISDVYRYSQESDTQQLDTTKGTVYGAYNAVTGYLQNVKEVKNQESQLMSLMEGTAFQYSQRAFDLCKTIIQPNLNLLKRHS